MRKLFVFLLLLALISSCSKQSELFLYVKSLDLDWKSEYAEGNKSVRFNVFAESKSSVVTRVMVQTYTPDGQTVTVLDSFLTSPVRKLDMDFQYTTPCFTELTNVEVSTTVWSQNGETCKYTLTLRVNPADSEVETYDSKTLFSAASYGASAFSWSHMEPYYPDSLSDMGLSFIDDLSEDSVTLSCSWSSQNLLFARFEGFNFAQATLQSIEQAYNNSSPTNRIRNIHEDDVILVGTPGVALGAIKIMLVSDKEGVEQDRYVFSIKARK